MSTGGPQRRLEAILAADVVGYSRLMGQDESGILAALKALRVELIIQKLRSMAAAFSRQQAMACLLNFQAS
jgi:adenylate cyclase